mgnify:CR=1 FL=1
MKQHSRRCFLRRSSAAVLWSWGGGLTLTAAAARPTLADADLLAQCRDRIRRHRYGDGVLTVQRADGKPLAGARVRLEQTRHEFLFGSNFFKFDRIPDPELQSRYNEQFAALLNYATLPFYWPSYERRRGEPAHAYAAKTADWCAARGIVCKGHPLVWDFADPSWLPRDFEEIRRLSRERVRECVGRFAGTIDRWDVVNEPTHLGRFGTRLGEWAQWLGPVPYVRQHLETARAAGPKATLLVNDYRVDTPYYRILEQLRAGEKRLFDVVGIQSHMHRGVWALARVWEICDAYAKLGLPIHFTETTVVSGAFLGRDPRRPGRALGNDEMWGESTPELEDRQAEQVRDFYTALFAHPAVHAITWWDFSDFRAWKGAPAGLLRKDMSTKPAGEALRRLIKQEWASKLDGPTDATGRLPARLSFGQYRALITLPNGTEYVKAFAWARESDRKPVLSI